MFASQFRTVPRWKTSLPPASVNRDIAFWVFRQECAVPRPFHSLCGARFGWARNDAEGSAAIPDVSTVGLYVDQRRLWCQQKIVI